MKTAFVNGTEFQMNNHSEEEPLTPSLAKSFVRLACETHATVADDETTWRVTPKSCKKIVVEDF